MPRQVRQQRGDAVIAVSEHRADETVHSRLGSRSEILSADNAEAIGRKHDVERGNCPAQSVGNNEPRADDLDFVAVGVTADSVERTFRSESRSDPVFGEVEKVRDPFDKGRFALDRGDDIGDMCAKLRISRYQFHLYWELLVWRLCVHLRL